MQMQIPQARVHGLSGLAWGLAQAVWVLLAACSFVVLMLLTAFFWHHYQVAPCEELDSNCLVTAAWVKAVGLPPWLLAALHVTGLLVPSLVWMTLGIAIAGAQPRRIWLWLVSLTFMVVWYSEMNLHAVRFFLGPAVNFALEIFGQGALRESPLLQNAIVFTRAGFKFLADNLLFMLAFCFPNGRMPPRWAKWVMFSFFLVSFCYSFPPFRDTALNYTKWPGLLSVAFNALLVLAWLSSLTSRLRHEDAGVRKQMRQIFPVMIVGGGFYFGS